MREIAIRELSDLKELNDFISQTNEKLNLIKGIVVADDGDIKEISKDIKELKQREDILKIAEGRLIKLAGIDRVGVTIENSRKQRLLANKNVQTAKQNIKNDAVNFFVSNADDLIKNSKASEAYKQNFNTQQIALDAISGKSKDFVGVLKIELSNLTLVLDNNARETSEKLAIIKKCDDDLVRDLDYLLSMPVDTLNFELKNRKIARNNEIEAAAEKLAAEKLAVVEAERAERLAKIEAGRLEAEAERDGVGDFDDGIPFDTIGAIKNARLTLSSISEKIEGIEEIIRKLSVIERGINEM